MSQTLAINPFSSLNILEHTELTADAAAAQAVVTVSNASGFSAGQTVILGSLGSETCELRTILSIAGNNLTLSANLSYKHNRFDKIYGTFGPQVKVYRAANVNGSVPAGASFSAILTISYEVDQSTTTALDPTGGDSYWYKQTFYNATSSNPFGITETSLADSTAARGGNAGNYCSIDDVKTAAGLQGNRWLSDTVVDQARKAAQDEVNGALTGIYTLPFNPVPARIANISARLAAGLLLTSPSGGRFASTFSEGQDKLKQARDDLYKLQTREQVLVDATGVSTASTSSSGFAMWPDDTTDEEAVEDGGRMFSTKDRY